jgi:hypothetical protein
MEETKKITAETIENGLLDTIKTLEITRKQIRKYETQLNLLYTELKTIKNELDIQNYGTVKTLVNLAGIRIEQTIEQENKWTE